MSQKTPAPETPNQEAQPAKKGRKFSFSFSFLRKSDTDKEFQGKVAPSKRELEAQSAKRKAQRARVQGGLKQHVLEPENETEEQIAQPA
jgi:hypothetical protein